MSLRLLRFEIHYQLKQPSSWLAGAVFLLLGIAFSRLTLGGEGVSAHAPFSVALNLGLLSLLNVFVVSVLTARTALRDRETGMDELIRTTPLGGRTLRLHALGGLLLVDLLVLALAVTAMMLPPALAGAPAGAAGPLDPVHHLRAFLVIAVPNTVLLVAFQFLVATLTTKALPVYLSGIGIYLGYFGISILGGSPLIAGAASAGTGSAPLAGILDPFGLVPVLDQTRLWTVAQMNTLPVAMEGALLENRLLWAGVAGLLTYLAVRLRPLESPFGGQLPASGESRSRPAAASARGHHATDYRASPQDPSGWRYALRSALSEARLQLSTRLRSIPFFVVGALWLALTLAGLTEAIGDGPFDTPFLPLTELIVPALFHPFQLVGSLVLIFFASEIAWSDDSTGMRPLIDASPVHGGTRFASGSLCLAVLSLLLVALLLAPAIGYQLVRGGEPDLSLYASLFYLLGVPWLLVGILTVAIQNFSPEKYTGMLVSVFLVILWHPLMSKLPGVDLPLTRFARGPELDYSAFAGFGPFLDAVHWHLFFWTLLSLLLGSLAVGTWRRGLDHGVWARLRELVAGGGKTDLRPTGVWGMGAVVLLATGCYIQIATIDTGYLVSEGQEELWRADYERRFSALSRLSRPVIEQVDLTFDLYPGDRRYEVQGRYRIVNESGVPIDSLLVGWDRWITNRGVSIQGAALAAEFPPFNHFLFVMEEPLGPGASTRVDFRMRVEQSAFEEYDPGHSLIENGSFVRLERKLPWLGYDPSLELQDAELRREHALIPRSEARSPSPAHTRHDARAGYTLTASTSGEQRIAAPGELTRAWRAGGRPHFRFESTGPMRMRYGIASGTYASETLVVPGGTAAARPGAGPAALNASTSGEPTPAAGPGSDQAHGTAIRLLHHPEHAVNAPLLREASRVSLAILTDLYGSLDSPSVTIAEIPSYHSEVAATSYPGIVFLREHAGLTGDFGALEEGRVNYLYRRTAHELAHQWWGDRLNPLRTAPGAAVLTETLAEYSAALVLRRRFGQKAFRSLMKREADRYLLYRGRIGGPEPALAEVTWDTDYVAYFKGPVVMNAVAGLIGEDALLGALSDLMSEAGGPASRGATVEDLYQRVEEVTPDRYRPLLEEWFRGSVTYDLRLADASVRGLSSDRYEVTARIVMEKSGSTTGVGSGYRPPAADAPEDQEDEAPAAAPGGEPVITRGQAEPLVIEIRRAPGSSSDSSRSRIPSPVDGGAEARIESRVVELRPGTQTIRFIVDSRPLRLELDPGVTRIDRNRANNVWSAAGTR